MRQRSFVFRIEVEQLSITLGCSRPIPQRVSDNPEQKIGFGRGPRLPDIGLTPFGGFLQPSGICQSTSCFQASRQLDGRERNRYSRWALLERAIRSKRDRSPAIWTEQRYLRIRFGLFCTRFPEGERHHMIHRRKAAAGCQICLGAAHKQKPCRDKKEPKGSHRLLLGGAIEVNQ